MANREKRSIAPRSPRNRPEALTIANLIGKEAQGNKYAGEKADVIVAGYGEKQGDSIQEKNASSAGG